MIYDTLSMFSVWHVWINWEGNCGVLGMLHRYIGRNNVGSGHSQKPGNWQRNTGSIIHHRLNLHTLTHTHNLVIPFDFSDISSTYKVFCSLASLMPTKIAGSINILAAPLVMWQRKSNMACHSVIVNLNGVIFTQLNSYIPSWCFNSLFRPV